MDKVSIGISSCLLGHEVRYDGGHKKNSYIEQTLGHFFTFSAFCPEFASGMGVPRAPIQLLATDQGVRCVVVQDHSIDVTGQLLDCAGEKHAWLSGLCGYIFKLGSPSCGMENVKVFGNGHDYPIGTGIFAQYIKDNFPLLPLADEGRLSDPELRENFIQRVFLMHHWQILCKQPLTVRRLTDFHSQLNSTSMVHEQTKLRMLGRIAANVKTENLKKSADNYIQTLMASMNNTVQTSY